MKSILLLALMIVLMPMLATAQTIEKPSHSSDSVVNHHNQHTHRTLEEISTSTSKSILVWLGRLHFISTHFPIALIIMAAIAELLQRLSPSLIYQNAARFMIIMACLTAIPTTLFGLAHSLEATFSNKLYDLFWWHRLFGISTTISVSLAALANELHRRKKAHLTKKVYFLFLIASVGLVATTGYLGGELTFGIGHLKFPQPQTQLKE